MCLAQTVYLTAAYCRPRCTPPARDEDLPGSAPPVLVSSPSGGLAYMYLQYFAPGSITTYGTELSRGKPGDGFARTIKTSSQFFAIGLAKIILPLFSAFMLKKARGAAPRGGRAGSGRGRGCCACGGAAAAPQEAFPCFTGAWGAGVGS